MIQIKINTIDRSDHIIWNSVNVKQNLTSQVDTARFKYRKYGSRTYVPDSGDEVEIYDGTTKIFGGVII